MINISFRGPRGRVKIFSTRFFRFVQNAYKHNFIDFCAEIAKLNNYLLFILFIVESINWYLVTVKKTDSLSAIMTILKTLIAGGQMYLRRSYATGLKFIETTRDNDTGNTAIFIDS